MINIAELLKDAPVGLQLYSPLFGPVVFKGISNSTIVVKGNCSQYFDKYGRPCGFLDADCLLFPSKEVPTWEGWTVPIKPKFKIGDWLVYKDEGTFCQNSKRVQIQTIEGGRYNFTQGTSGSCPFIDNECRLWTIEDAQDGDILISELGNPFIYNGKIGLLFLGAYVGISRNGEIKLDLFPSKSWTGFNVKPATKEQQELLLAKLKEIGYQWDKENKELKKIQPHYDISNFHPGMPVLVRDRDDDRWSYVEFSHYFTCNNGEIYFNACGLSWKHCIPFKGNEALVGTRNPCKKEYINW